MLPQIQVTLVAHSALVHLVWHISNIFSNEIGSYYLNHGSFQFSQKQTVLQVMNNI